LVSAALAAQVNADGGGTGITCTSTTLCCSGCAVGGQDALSGSPPTAATNIGYLLGVKLFVACFEGNLDLSSVVLAVING